MGNLRVTYCNMLFEHDILHYTSGEITAICLSSSEVNGD